MPKRDALTARPHDHLLNAAAAHERAATGTQHPAEGEPDEETAAKAAEKSERVKRQPRRDKGRFA